MKTFNAPEGKLVTVLVDGVEVAYVPGKEYPDSAEFVVTSPLTEQPASIDKRGIEPYRAAIMVNEGGVDEKNSVKGAIVGGTVTGEHEVSFFGASERIRISHSAENRSVFAVGALRAAEFLVGQAPGLYSMDDVVGRI